MLTLVATTGWKCPQRFLAEYYFVVRKKGFISISYLLWHFPALGNTHCLFFFFFCGCWFSKASRSVDCNHDPYSYTSLRGLDSKQLQTHLCKHRGSLCILIYMLLSLFQSSSCCPKHAGVCTYPHPQSHKSSELHMARQVVHVMAR